VIDELTVDVCLRSDQPGAQLLLRVVLPRSKDPATNQLTTVLLSGPRYIAPGQWQTLHMEKLTEALDDRVRLLRAQSSWAIDSREAYLDAVLVNGYSGAGELDLWLGDPRLDGFVRQSQAAALQALPPQLNEPTSRSISVRTRGGIMEVDQRPFFPRAIEEQGEDWRYLRELGFNTVRLHRSVTAQDLASAERHQMWLMAPPPTEQEWPLIKRHCDRVLIWDLSRIPHALNQDHLRHLADVLQRSAKQAARPFACEMLADDDLPARIEVVIRPPRSAAADVVSDEHSSVLVGNSLAWGTVQTSLPEALADQLSWFGVNPLALAPEEAQVQQQVMAAVLTGARGLLFRSTQRLDAPSASARQRSLILRQVNTMLDTVSPWLSSGICDVAIGEDAVQRGSAASTSYPGRLQGAVLFKPAGSLAVLTHFGDLDQFVPSPAVSTACTITVKGASATDDVVYLAPDLVRRVPSRSVPGGMAVPFEHPQSVDLLVFTHDDAVMEKLAQRWTRGHLQRLDDALALARLMNEDTIQVLQAIESVMAQDPQSWVAVEQARAEITRAHHARDHKNWTAAWNHLRCAQAGTAGARRQTWERALHGQRPTTCPLTMQFGALSNYVRFHQTPPFQSAGWNVLPAGDCESLAAMQRAGWRYEPSLPGDPNRPGPVELLVFHDRKCLRLASPDEVRPLQPSGSNGPSASQNSYAPRRPVHAAERSMQTVSYTAPVTHDPRGASCDPVRLISPSVRLAQGQLVRIHGWVNIPVNDESDHRQPIQWSVYDSYAGKDLADRRCRTNGWEPFTLYRAASTEQPLTVTFEWSGAGSVYLAELSVTAGAASAK
jgi:hypothetical protein